MEDQRHYPVQLLTALAMALGLTLSGCTAAIDAQSRRPPERAGITSPEGVRDATPALSVTFLDVGQGDAALIRTPDGVTALVDGGPSSAGPRVVEALRRSGLKKIDWVIGTHPHEDHIGGLIDVLRAFPAASALDPGYSHGTATQRTYLELLRDKKIRTIRARSGQTYDLGARVKLEILAPEEPLLSGTNSDPNNNSIVARLTYGSRRFLFTGDMETEERRRLQRTHPATRLRSDVLKVAHHGSHNGTDLDFLRAVQPQYAVISLGKKNEYGHPHREPLQQLKNARVQVLRTDELGAITFHTDGRALRHTADRTAPVAQSSRQPQGPTRNAAQRPGSVIGNRSSQVYHAPECNSLPGENRRVRFDNATLAEKSGFRPHAACTGMRQ